MPGVQHSTGRTSAAAALLSLAVAVLAWVEPVESVQSDPALTLIAAQAVVEHRSLALDPYRGDPRCAYDLDHDYRVRAHGGSLYRDVQERARRRLEELYERL